METRAITASNLPTLICLTSDQINISHSQQVLEFCQAGVALIQFRSKTLSKEDFLQEAKIAVEISQDFDAKIFINDSVEVASAVDANGVHLGVNDMPVAKARNILGESKIIGATIHSEHEINESILAHSDYIGMGPFRKSNTKSDLTPVLNEFEYRSMIKQVEPKPVYLIGGIELEDFSLNSKLGNHGFAVCSNLFNGIALDTIKIKQFVEKSRSKSLLEI